MNGPHRVDKQGIDKIRRTKRPNRNQRQQRRPIAISQIAQNGQTQVHADGRKRDDHIDFRVCETHGVVKGQRKQREEHDQPQWETRCKSYGER